MVMKTEGVHLFANLFGAKGGREKVATEGSTEVMITSSAQPHVLREKMKEKELSHGETVTVNMSPVRLEAAFGKMLLYFCPMEDLEVIEKITAGDGGDIPHSAIVEGLNIPSDFRSGLYALKNVRLSSNGSIQVMASADTTWEKV